MSRIIERALSIINDNLKDQTSSFADPISIKPMARGGRLLEDDYPTHYLPHVGRQVMADGGDADPIGGALDVAQSIPETPMPSLRPTPPAPSVPSAEGRVRAPDRKTNEIGHYSSAAEAAYALKQSKGPASQMIGALKNMPGVKPEEIKWSGVEDAFDPKEMITKDDLVNHFNKKLPDVEETVLRKQSSYPYREADEWQEAIDTAERRRNFDEAERLQRAWEEYEGHGAAFGGDKPPKFEQYSLPGGENYREVLLHLPTQSVSEEEARKILDAKPDAKLSQADIDYASRKVAQEYKSSHWDEPNVLGHLRMSDRDNGKTLHLEELQSDWGQEGRKKGFRGDPVKYGNKIEGYIPQGYSWAKTTKPNLNYVVHQLVDPSGKVVSEGTDKIDALRKSKLDPTIPPAPYVTNTQSWTDLGLKRALQEAAEGGYDKMIWTPGEEQAARYDLSKHIDELHWNAGNLVAYDPDGYKIIQRTGLSKEELPNLIGKEAADKLLSQEADKEGWRYLDSEGLKVGGEGMQSFYDKIVPTQLNKLIKKLDPNAKIEMGGHTIDVGKGKPTQYRDFDEYAKAPGSRQIKAHVLHITPELRKKVLEGLPAYAQGGEVNDGAPPAQAVESVSEDADNNQSSTYAKENDLLQPIGKSKMAGDEKLFFDDGLYKAGTSTHAWNNKKSIRYLRHDEDGNPIGALQIMTHGPRTKKATIQNVYVAEDHRRKKIASELLKRARQDFDVRHSTDLTDQGRAFAKAAKAYGGSIIPGPKLTEENADDFARRLIAWTFATAPLFHKASGGSVIDDPLDVISKLRR